MMNEFIKVANNFVFVANKEYGEVSILKSMDKTLADKLLGVLIYIHCNRNILNNKCKFTIEELIKFLGYKPKTGKGKINDIVITLIKEISGTYITNVDVDLNKVKINQLITCDMDIFDLVDYQFFKLDIKSINKIMTSGYDNKLELLNTYCYICARTYTRKKEEKEIYDNGMKDCLTESFYDTYDRICFDLNLSRPSYNKVLKELNELELVYYDNVGSLIKDGKPDGNANNVYVLNKEELKLALERSRFYYEERGYTIKHKPSAKAKRENGIKGKKAQMEKANKEFIAEDKKECWGVTNSIVEDEFKDIQEVNDIAEGIRSLLDFFKGTDKVTFNEKIKITKDYLKNIDKDSIKRCSLVEIKELELL
ncbi:MAG: hypothetical protein ACRDD7_10940, partial [Peptostreptococcaceae bacterium]